MQPNRQKPSQNRSLYSKFKMWCAFHNIPLFLIPCILFFAVAVTALLIGGSIVGWDIAGFLKSPTGILMYVVIGLAILGGVYYFFTTRNK